MWENISLHNLPRSVTAQQLFMIFLATSNANSISYSEGSKVDASEQQLYVITFKMLLKYNNKLTCYKINQ